MGYSLFLMALHVLKKATVGSSPAPAAAVPRPRRPRSISLSWRSYCCPRPSTAGLPYRLPPYSRAWSLPYPPPRCARAPRECPADRLDEGRAP